jgi:hypothetical protein
MRVGGGAVVRKRGSRAKRRPDAAEICDQADGGRRPEVQDAEHVGRGFVDAPRPIVGEIHVELGGNERRTHALREFFQQSVTGVQDVVAARLVAKRGTGA